MIMSEYKARLLSYYRAVGFKISLAKCPTSMTRLIVVGVRDNQVVPLFEEHAWAAVLYYRHFNK